MFNKNREMMTQAGLSRRGFLAHSARAAATLALGPSLLGAATEAEATAKPNIIVILVDDMGWGDLSCQPQAPGVPDARIRTPNLDSMAAEGVRCTQAYSTCMVCAPARAGLITGRYQQKFGWYEFKETLAGIPDSEITIAQALKKKGYATACFGKWHLGYEPHQGPLQKGFDRFYGFLGGQHDFFDVRNGDPCHGFPHDLDAPILDQKKPVESMKYMTDELTDQTMTFIKEQQSQAPFFVYLAYNAPHPPLQATWDKLEPYAEQRDGQFNSRDIARAMIDSVDEGVGRILNQLMHLGIDENTLIFFSSDNGGHDDSRTLVQHNGGLRARKGFYWEGGIRVPMLVRWPKELGEGIVYDKPVTQLDIYATCLQAAGYTQPPGPVDGVDLIPYFNGRNKDVPHEALYWGLEPEVGRWAIRKGKWKLTREYVDAETLYNQEYEFETALHDIEADPYEKHNLIEKHPKIAEELQAEMDAWLAACPPTIATPDLMATHAEELERRYEKRPHPNLLRYDGAPGHGIPLDRGDD